jgi:hypothetical protein
MGISSGNICGTVLPESTAAEQAETIVASRTTNPGSALEPGFVD